MGMLGPWVLLSLRRTPRLPPGTGSLAQLSFGDPLHQALQLLGEGSWVLRPRLPTPLPLLPGDEN